MADTTWRDVIAPDLGSDHPVPIAEVFVSMGDEVRKEDPLLSLESEKAVMDLPAPFDGIIREILVEADQEIETGTILFRMELSGAGELSPKTEEESKPAVAPQPEKPVPAEPLPAEAPELSIPEKGERTNLSHASPSVRLYARELGVDLSALHGTGPKNRIRREDVQDYVKTLASGRSVQGSPGVGLPPFPYRDPAEFGSVREEGLTGIQKYSSVHLHSSWVNIPHVTHFEKADITGLEEWREALNRKAPEGRKFTTLAFAVKAVTAAVKDYPRFNSVLAPEGDRVLLREYYNVGIAVDTPKGLLVPVLRDTDAKGLGDLADEIISLAARGRQGGLTAAEMSGAGITITNLGGIGGTSFTPIINPPETAILGLSRSVREPVWNGEAFVPRLMLPLSLSYDHRVIDGAMAAAFAARLSYYLSDMRNIML